jgi:hypothetical protein
MVVTKEMGPLPPFWPRSPAARPQEQRGCHTAIRLQDCEKSLLLRCLVGRAKNRHVRGEVPLFGRRTICVNREAPWSVVRPVALGLLAGKRGCPSQPDTPFARVRSALLNRGATRGRRAVGHAAERRGRLPDGARGVRPEEAGAGRRGHGVGPRVIARRQIR